MTALDDNRFQVIGGIGITATAGCLTSFSRLDSCSNSNEGGFH